MKDISVDVAMEQRSNVLLIQCWLGDGVSFLVGDVVLTKKSKQRGHIQKTSDHYIPSFIDLNKFSSRNVFFFSHWGIIGPVKLIFGCLKFLLPLPKIPAAKKVMSLAPLAFGSFVHFSPPYLLRCREDPWTFDDFHCFSLHLDRIRFSELIRRTIPHKNERKQTKQAKKKEK